MATALLPGKRLVEDQFEFAGKFHTGVWIRATELLLPSQAVCRMEREEFNTSTTVLEVDAMELEGGGAPKNAEPLPLEDDKVAKPEMIVPGPFNNTRKRSATTRQRISRFQDLRLLLFSRFLCRRGLSGEVLWKPNVLLPAAPTLAACEEAEA